MIKIDNLKIQYSTGQIFHVSDISFKEGEISSIIGKNGSGKTTVLRALAGLSRYKGSITLDGRETRDYKGRERARHVAYLPQVLSNVNMDVLTLVEHGRYPYHGNFRRMSGEDRDKVERALELTSMTGSRNRNVKELSGGERQRAYLAVIIAQDAPMILLDEPTTYMDLKAQGMFFDILKRLACEGHGVVMTMHDLEQCFRTSDRICLMDKGCLLRHGTADEIAGEEEHLRALFGVSVRKSEDDELLYPYVMVK